MKALVILTAVACSYSSHGPEESYTTQRSDTWWTTRNVWWATNSYTTPSPRGGITCYICNGYANHSDTCWSYPYRSYQSSSCNACMTYLIRNDNRPWEDGQVVRACMPRGDSCSKMKLGATTIFKSCCYSDNCNIDRPSGGSHLNFAKFWLTSALLLVGALISV